MFGFRVLCFFGIFLWFFRDLINRMGNVEFEGRVFDGIGFRIFCLVNVFGFGKREDFIFNVFY